MFKFLYKDDPALQICQLESFFIADLISFNHLFLQRTQFTQNNVGGNFSSPAIAFIAPGVFKIESDLFSD
jgi:hypothetical protein